jgi:hypothetical protein
VPPQDKNSSGLSYKMEHNKISHQALNSTSIQTPGALELKSKKHREIGGPTSDLKANYNSNSLKQMPMFFKNSSDGKDNDTNVLQPSQNRDSFQQHASYQMMFG